jgi:hypothetical protein
MGWALGQVLKAPRYQNICMAGLLSNLSEQKEAAMLMSVTGTEEAYKCTKKGSLLRKLTVDC